MKNWRNTDGFLEDADYNGVAQVWVELYDGTRGWFPKEKYAPDVRRVLIPDVEPDQWPSEWKEWTPTPIEPEDPSAAWRRQDGTRFESHVEEVNRAWGKGKHDNICEELHDHRDGAQFKEAWVKSGNKWGKEWDAKYGRWREGPRITSNNQIKEACRLSRQLAGKRGFATYGD